MGSRRYDAVLFDAGDTLVHPDPSFGGLLVELMAGFGLRFEEDLVERHVRQVLGEAVAAAAASGQTWSTTPERSRAFWTRTYRALLGRLSVEDGSDTIASALYDQFAQPSRYALFPDSAPTLRELAEQGYVLGVVSNWEGWLAGLLERLGIAPLLRVMVVSGAEGVEKPDPRIFSLALERGALEPGRTVYVGDSLTHDVAPALAMGMGAVLLDRHGKHRRARVPIVGSLEEVAAVIR